MIILLGFLCVVGFLYLHRRISALENKREAQNIGIKEVLPKTLWERLYGK